MPLKLPNGQLIDDNDPNYETYKNQPGTTTQTTAPTSTPVDTTTPAPAQTANDIYGDLTFESPEERAFREQQGAASKSAAETKIDEAKIRRTTRDRFQEEIDALNKVYAEKKREEVVAGQNRLGQTAAIGARRGLLGSSFGEARRSTQEKANTVSLGAIEAQRANAEQGILSEARQLSDAEITKQEAARKLGATEYLNYINTSSASKQANAQAIAKRLYETETFETADLENIAGQLGVSVDALKSSYDNYSRQAEAAAQAAGLETRKTLAEIGKTEAEAGVKQREITQFDIDNAMATNKVKADFMQQAFDNNIALDELQLNRDKYTTDTEFRNAQLELDTVKAQATIDNMYDQIKQRGTTSAKELLEIEKLQQDINKTKAVADKEKINAGKSVDILNDKITLIDALLNDKAGIDSVVGPNRLSRSVLLNPTNIAFSQAAGFVGNVKLLADKETLDALLGLKERGGTLGAISEKELSILQNSANKISGWEDPNNPGKYVVSEKLFLEELQRIKDSATRLRDASQADAEAGVGVGNKTTFENVDDFLQNSSTVQQEAADNLQKDFLKTEGVELSDKDLIDLINEQGSTSFNNVGSDTNQAALPKTVAKAEDGDKGGQCGRFVNKATGLGVGDTFNSKMAKMDPSIKKPEPGMVFTSYYKDTGHCGFIVGVKGDKVIVKDSNWGKDEKVQTHEMNLSSIRGLKRV